MTTLNPFDLLGDGDSEDPVELAAALPVPVSQPLKPLAKKAKDELKQGGPQEIDGDSFDNGNTNGSSNGFSGGYGQSENGKGRKQLVKMDYGDNGGRPYERKGGYGDNGGGTYERKGGYGDNGGRPYERKGGYGDNGGRTYERKGGYSDNGGRTYDKRGGYADNGGRTYDKSGGFKTSDEGEGDKSFERIGGYGGDGGKPYEGRGGFRPSEDRGGRPFERRDGYGRGGKPYEKAFNVVESYGGDGGRPHEKRGNYRSSEEGDGNQYENRGGYRPSEETYGGGGNRNDGRGGYGGGGKPYERQRGYRSATEEGEMGKPFESKGGNSGSRGGYHGSRRNGPLNGENADGEQPRGAYERHSGSGNGSEMKRNGSGCGNWGTPTDGVSMEPEESMNEGTKTDSFEKQDEQPVAGDANKGSRPEEQEVKEPEKKLYTLDEYERMLEEKRKALQALKPEERKVCLDKDFESMQLLANKKNEEEIFIKLASEKEKKKEVPEKVKKTKPINEILKFADSRRYNGSGGRGSGIRGRGPGGRGYDETAEAAKPRPPPKKKMETPKIEDVAQFPTLGSK
ncbi:unnamed protein product [Cuscuta campestris]|uniref:Hyaluronan/mRNA-binding protein domain-containing protein n=1 Tax=Cuscuta campestris TaxID=132261 RepID=A0A484KCT5_9ASTE|nr:unnamed protein product [Cuscuta campestris]